MGRGFVAFIANNEALLDALLYDWYPDRLPGELDDTLDVLRFFRMVAAKGIMQIEDARHEWLDKGSESPKSDKAKARHSDNLRRWAEHDRLLAEYGDLT